MFQKKLQSDSLTIVDIEPEAEKFCERAAALRWMEEKDRRSRESTKAGKQEWFSKVFADDDKEDGEVKEKELKRKF